MKRSIFITPFIIILFILSCSKIRKISDNVSSSENSYTVVFDSNCGKSVEIQEVKEGNNLMKPADPERLGYDFLGWFIGDRQWSFEKDSVTTDITLTAKWKAIFETRIDDGKITLEKVINRSISSVIIPSKIDGYDVEYIGETAFARCKELTSVIIPSSVKSIGASAFAECESLISITIGDGVTSIEDSAFINCKSLTRITIPENVISIGDMAFYNCISLENITIESGVKKIGSGAFVNCVSLESIILPDSIYTIKSGLFYGCKSLKSIIFGSGVRTIENEAFACCTSLTNLIIPNHINYIKDYAFADCTSLESVIMGSGVVYVGYGAFFRCTSLEKAMIAGNNVRIIENNVFSDCPSLAIYCKVSEKPEGWRENWNSGRPVVWGYNG